MYICKQSGPGWTPSSDPFALAALLSTGIVGVCHSARVCVCGGGCLEGCTRGGQTSFVESTL